MKSPNTRPEDLLRRPSVTAREGFTQALLDRLESENVALDRALDLLLAAQPLRTGEGFTRSVVARAAGPARGWRHLRSVAAAAAAVALATVVLSDGPGRGGPHGPAVAEHPAGVASLAEDPLVAEVFLLAEGLSDARPLLDDSARQTLTALTQ